MVTVQYVLGAQAQALVAAQAATTTQGALPKGNGVAWRTNSFVRGPNTRVAALQAIQAVAPCTAAQAQAALQAAKAQGVHLGTGTPRSYVAAFIKNGYLAAPVAAPAKGKGK